MISRFDLLKYKIPARLLLPAAYENVQSVGPGKRYWAGSSATGHLIYFRWLLTLDIPDMIKRGGT